MKGLVAFLAVLALAAAARAAEPFDPFHEAGIDEHPGAQVPVQRVFLDQTGARVSLAALARGRPVVLVPVQHRCPNICGATLAGLVQAVKGQADRPGKDFTLVAFGIDPREGPSDAAVSLQRLQPLGGEGVYALTGSAADVAAVTNALGYRYAWDPRIGQYAHVAAAAVLTPKGRLAGWLYGVQPSPEVLHTALDAASRGGLVGIADRLILYCYHYDPQTGRYGPLAWTLLRGAAVAVLLAIVLMIGLAVLRERRRRAAP